MVQATFFLNHCIADDKEASALSLDFPSSALQQMKNDTVSMLKLVINQLEVNATPAAHVPLTLNQAYQLLLIDRTEWALYTWLVVVRAGFDKGIVFVMPITQPPAA